MAYYYNCKTWQLSNQPTEGKCVRIPLVAALLIAPILGGALVVALPFIGFALTFHAIGKYLARQLVALKHALAPQEMAAGASYFAGKGEPTEKPSNDETLEELQKEIDSKRNV
jgi:hypothetical protein